MLVRLRVASWVMIALIFSFFASNSVWGVATDGLTVMLTVSAVEAAALLSVATSENTRVVDFPPKAIVGAVNVGWVV